MSKPTSPAGSGNPKRQRPRKKEAAPDRSPLRWRDTPPDVWDGKPVRKHPEETARFLAALIAKTYVMIDPRDGVVRYVGFTVQPLNRRLINHVTAARSGKKARVLVWIRELLDEGLKPVIERLEADTEADGIAMFPSGQLYNETGAGGGRRPNVEWPPEWVAVIGGVPDHVLASWRGISKDVVHRLRVEFGIPPYRDSEAEGPETE